MSLFVDTWVWYAVADSSGAGSQRARQILSGGEPLVTSDHVLVESWALIHRRVGRRAAEKFWEGLRQGAVWLECVGPADLEAAWHIGADFRDQDFSIVDRTSFAVMRRLGIERAASFDGDFAVFRFGPHRRQAFTIVR